jgi:hypothetical protein
MDNQRHAQQQLLIDGYLAHMFGALAAERYHVSLLKRESQHINWQTKVSGSLVFFFAPAPRDGLGPDRGYWIIDYVTKDTGPVIPQQIWAPQNSSDALRRYVEHEQMCPPIFLVHRDSVDLGFPLTDAAAGNCMSLRGADQTAPVGSGVHAQIRINVS